MDLTSTKSLSSSDVTQTSSLSAKLKRLQIEEGLLLQSIHKCVPEAAQTDGDFNASTSYLTSAEFKSFLGKTKNSYKEIKLLFQDIKTSTSSKEMLKTLDIDDIKKSTLELENRIKAFKLYLQTELTGLKFAEQQLNETLNENPVLISKLKRQPRIQTAKYNEIVPSPVKTMMTSPFKSAEVQQFQEFMMNSANRYGGWNEYHHNIFVNHWQKYFGSQADISFEGNSSMETSPTFPLFLYELLPKLQDISEEEIISHVKWYSKYVYLKDRQQKAIDKWRSNRKVMKSAKVEAEVKKDNNVRNKIIRRKTVNNFHFNLHNNVSDEFGDIKDLVPQSSTQDEVRFIRKCHSETFQEACLGKDQPSSSSNVDKLTSKDCEGFGDHRLLHFQKPTKQWCIRINRYQDNNIETNMNNLENINKLRVPAWRVGL